MKSRFQRIFTVVTGALLLCAVAPAPARELPRNPASPTREGRIDLPGGSYFWHMSLKRVEIVDAAGHLVFRAEDPDRGSRVLTCGHAPGHGFTAFFQRVDHRTGERRLRLLSSLRPPVETIASPVDLFSPVLATDHGDVVFALTDTFEIRAWELATGRLIWQKRFDAPVIAPRRIRIAGREALEFRYFHEGRYRRFHFFTGPSLPPDRIYGPDPAFLPHEPESPGSVPPDPHTIMAFGDSITYGYVDYTPAPEKGYVPRLQLLLDGDYPGMTMINAGIPGETTVDAMDRYAETLAGGGAAYLLFHEGTNDVIHVGTIPVSVTLFNIRTIMQYSLNLGMQPVLTTLIPRSPFHSSGQGINRQRAEEIRAGILELAADFSLPLIDFWSIFENHPVSDGGYLSLMSDYVHPSEKGYQLMAENWYRTLLDIPPAAPRGITVTAASPWRVDLVWDAGREFDLAEYVVHSGVMPGNLDHQAVVSTPRISLLRPPFRGELLRERWVRIAARDRSGNTGPASPLMKVEFHTPADPARGNRIQKVTPRVKRIPLKLDDRVESPR